MILSDVEEIPAMYRETFQREKKQPLEIEQKRFVKPKDEQVVIPIPQVFLSSVRKYLKDRKGNIPDIFTFTKILSSAERESSSLSVMMLGDFKLGGSDYEIFVKLGFEYFDVFDNRNMVENDIYKYVISSLSLNTPHVLQYYGRYSMDSVSFEDESLAFDFEQEVRFIGQSDEVNVDKMEALFLERTSGKSLHDYILTLSEEKLCIVLFQVFYTLLCFEVVNMIHLDLHTSNVLVDILPYSKAIYYDIRGKTYRLESDILAKVFDFDRSRVYSDKVVRNFNIDAYFCESHGICNGQDNTFDAYYLLSIIYIQLLENNIGKNIRDLISSLISTNIVERDEKEGNDFRFKVRKEQTCASLGECLNTFLGFLLKTEYINEVDYNPVYVYKFPPVQGIRWGNPKLSISGSPLLPSSILEEDEEEYMRDNQVFQNMQSIWRTECRDKFNYSTRENIRILRNAYSKRYSLLLGKMEKYEIRRNYRLSVISVFVYLSYPMFYSFTQKQLIAALTKNEYSVLLDMIHFLGKNIPIRVPLISHNI